MPKLDLAAIVPKTGGGYPPPYELTAPGRNFRSLSAAAGIVDQEINLVELPEGAWSSQRHWHEGEDEFLVLLSGNAVLVDDSGETPLSAGDFCAFPKGDGNGHHLRGGDGGCVFVVWGKPEATPCHYPDVDLELGAGEEFYRHKDGRPYER